MNVMAYPKFILTSGGYLRLGMVTLHRHLLESGEHCIGGGYYRIDALTGTLVLEGASSDFGRPRWGDVDEIVVPAMYRGMSIVYRYHDGDYYPASDHIVSYD